MAARDGLLSLALKPNRHEIHAAHRSPVGIRLPGRFAKPAFVWRCGYGFFTICKRRRQVTERSPGPTGGLESNITAHFGKGILESAVSGGNILCDIRFDDGAIATSKVGSYRPNSWGLYDMHGNASEWTRTAYKPYPYKDDDGRNDLTESGRKVVRGGSWRDRPKRCRSAFRLSYPAWQRVHNVGFRVVCRIENSEQKYANVANIVEGDETQQDLGD